MLQILGAIVVSALCVICLFIFIFGVTDLFK